MRHPRLRPLSRDHHGALVHARRLRQAADDGAPARIEDALQALARGAPEILDHFAAEEQYLLPLMTDELAQRLLGEHRQLRDGMQRLTAMAGAGAGESTVDADAMRTFGEQLAAHVRWEEGDLFPWIESHASPAELDALAGPMTDLEQRRGRPDRIRDDD